MSARRVFLSAANAEFAGLAKELDVLLREVGIEVVFQPVLGQVTVDTLEKLHDAIAPCDLVVHLAGHEPGTPADQRCVDAYLADDRGKDFLARDAGLQRRFFELPAPTYTQWEAYIALHIPKPLLVYSPYDAFDSGGTVLASFAQKPHTDLLSTAGRYPYPFTESANILTGIYKHFGIPDPTPQRISPPKFLHHAAEHFLGREAELKLLDDAWTAAQQTDHPTNLLSLIAWGGVGKTALLAHWLQTRFVDHSWKTTDGSPHPQAYFDWSFYDQGTASGDDDAVRTGSVGDFFERALVFFGDPDPNLPGKGARLAERVRAQPSLLVLDGLEPLQHPPNHPQAGHLLDPDLRDLLSTLALSNPGLCIITSRQPLTDLTPSTSARQENLNELPRETAVRLLRKLQVTGTDDELADAADALDRHALSLTLLGRYLFDAHGGDVRKRDLIDLHTADDATRPERHRTAWKILEVYDKWLGTEGSRPEEHAVLRLLGLFDRPATPGCLKALREEPPIPGLTEHLTPLDDAHWNILLNRLARTGLITLRQTADNPDPFIDAHPLVREYFAHQLKTAHPDAFKQAHSRLFDHLCATTEHQPDTLEALQPLYQAVTHGCHAARHQEACDDVYFTRILRGTGSGGNYSAFQLGAISADLGAIAAFFEHPWDRLAPDLAPHDQAWLLNEAASSLRALGRLTEALQPMRAGLEMAVTAEDWKNAAIGASSLSDMNLSLGNLPAAADDATQAVDYADRSRDAFQRMARRTTAADAHHQSGDPAAARALLAEAETLQRERQPQFRYLYSLAGFRYCDLLLAPAEQAAWRTHLTATLTPPQDLTEVEKRAAAALEIATRNSWLLDIALDHLTLARLTLYRALLTATSPDPNPHLAPALGTLRKSNNLDQLPLALLTAALHHHVSGDPTLAEQHLAEAQLIAERGPMPLYLADVHLHRARLFRNKSELAKAAELIKKHGYGRRDQELEDAEAAADSW